jgi:hypothetical protein
MEIITEDNDMKNANIKIQIEQLGIIIRDELNIEQNEDRVCALLDAQEYLRRAWHCIDGTPTEDNDTTTEIKRKSI